MGKGARNRKNKSRADRLSGRSEEPPILVTSRGCSGLVTDHMDGTEGACDRGEQCTGGDHSQAYDCGGPEECEHCASSMTRCAATVIYQHNPATAPDECTDPSCPGDWLSKPGGRWHGPVLDVPGSDYPEERPCSDAPAGTLRRQCPDCAISA